MTPIPVVLSPYMEPADATLVEGTPTKVPRIVFSILPALT